jgi:hypothetical protein
MKVILGLDLGDDAAIATQSEEMRAAIFYAHEN